MTVARRKAMCEMRASDAKTMTGVQTTAFSLVLTWLQMLASMTAAEAGVGSGGSFCELFLVLPFHLLGKKFSEVRRGVPSCRWTGGRVVVCIRRVQSRGLSVAIARVPFCWLDVPLAFCRLDFRIDELV